MRPFRVIALRFHLYSAVDPTLVQSVTDTSTDHLVWPTAYRTGGKIEWTDDRNRQTMVVAYNPSPGRDDKDGIVIHVIMIKGCLFPRAAGLHLQE